MGYRTGETKTIERTRHIVTFEAGVEAADLIADLECLPWNAELVSFVGQLSVVELTFESESTKEPTAAKVETGRTTPVTNPKTIEEILDSAVEEYLSERGDEQIEPQIRSGGGVTVSYIDMAKSDLSSDSW